MVPCTVREPGSYLIAALFYLIDALLAASLTALFKHIKSTDEPCTDETAAIYGRRLWRLRTVAARLFPVRSTVRKYSQPLPGFYLPKSCRREYLQVAGLPGPLLASLRDRLNIRDNGGIFLKICFISEGIPVFLKIYFPSI
ncbi:hypothetical protein NE237_027339 [Protea cynaroides]|uniref:Uncharacterized protein n=1 Tax=Protea cynaroides TaxID=273540 RepID=A0A9Q0JT25_9MAGN|nr:hypothetical protein NE237_027339 [Protea cynaroides]